MARYRRGQLSWLLMFAALFAVIIFAGCGGGDTTDAPPDDGGDQPIPDGTLAYQVSDQTLGLTTTTEGRGQWAADDPLVTVEGITDVTEDSVTLQVEHGNARDITEGQILVRSAADNPFIRRVEHIETTDSGFVLETSEAGIAEAFEELRVNVRTGISDFSGLQPVEGVTLGEPEPALSPSASDKWAEDLVSLPMHVDIPLADDEHGEIKLTGDITAALPVEIYIECEGFAIKRFYATLGVSCTGDLRLEGSYSDTPFTYDAQVPLTHPWYGPPIFVGPLVFLPEVRLTAYVKAGITIEARAQVQVSAALRAQAGPEYVAGTGWGIRTVPSNLDDVLTFQPSYDFSGRVRGDLTVVPLNMIAALKLYGAAGPRVRLTFGAESYLETSTQGNEHFNCLQAEADGNLYVEAAPGAEITGLPAAELDPVFILVPLSELFPDVFPMTVPIVQEGGVPVVIQ